MPAIPMARPAQPRGAGRSPSSTTPARRGTPPSLKAATAETTDIAARLMVR